MRGPLDDSHLETREIGESLAGMHILTYFWVGSALGREMGKHSNSNLKKKKGLGG